jgi:hypothetical protein
VTIGFEHQLQRVSVVLIVIDDKDAGQIRCHEHLDLFSLSNHLRAKHQASSLGQILIVLNRWDATANTGDPSL